MISMTTVIVAKLEQARTSILPDFIRIPENTYKSLIHIRIEIGKGVQGSK